MGRTQKAYHQRRKRPILARMEVVSELYKRGYSYREIQKEVITRLGLSSYALGSVHKDVQQLLAEWREYRITKVDEVLQLELERIDELIKEAWIAWEKSKEDYQRKRGKRQGMPLDSGNGGIETLRVEEVNEDVTCYGDPRYLDVVNKNLIERRKLLGLYAPEKREVSSTLSFVDVLMESGKIDAANASLGIKTTE